ncbi:hypothetical protein [Chromobacterium sp. IIBBL 290-4]|uniref:hypothetical protein n=1 Tax=Chromobacterium sp. IIBBL 290-4 TaxID=2953890 RepID=UPI0020B7FD36|nr:hypothetical protein [Chromobacterium sp. IIBBL 290-4]UTH74111.1 hypothetical protein NKT35_21625 [Chromobacterium sp. IIBBL 290-4]
MRVGSGSTLVSNIGHTATDVSVNHGSARVAASAGEERNALGNGSAQELRDLLVRRPSKECIFAHLDDEKVMEAWTRFRARFSVDPGATECISIIKKNITTGDSCLENLVIHKSGKGGAGEFTDRLMLAQKTMLMVSLQSLVLFCPEDVFHAVTEFDSANLLAQAAIKKFGESVASEYEKVGEGDVKDILFSAVGCFKEMLGELKVLNEIDESKLIFLSGVKNEVEGLGRLMGMSQPPGIIDRVVEKGWSYAGYPSKEDAGALCNAVSSKLASFYTVGTDQDGIPSLSVLNDNVRNIGVADLAKFMDGALKECHEGDAKSLESAIKMAVVKSPFFRLYHHEERTGVCLADNLGASQISLRLSKAKARGLMLDFGEAAKKYTPTNRWDSVANLASSGKGKIDGFISGARDKVLEKASDIYEALPLDAQHYIDMAEEHPMASSAVAMGIGWCLRGYLGVAASVVGGGGLQLIRSPDYSRQANNTLMSAVDDAYVMVREKFENVPNFLEELDKKKEAFEGVIDMRWDERSGVVRFNVSKEMRGAGVDELVSAVNLKFIELNKSDNVEAINKLRDILGGIEGFKIEDIPASQDQFILVREGVPHFPEGLEKMMLDRVSMLGTQAAYSRMALDFKIHLAKELSPVIDKKMQSLSRVTRGKAEILKSAKDMILEKNTLAEIGVVLDDAIYRHNDFCRMHSRSLGETADILNKFKANLSRFQ